jgi:hypothetical protein
VLSSDLARGTHRPSPSHEGYHWKNHEDDYQFSLSFKLALCCEHGADENLKCSFKRCNEEELAAPDPLEDSR